MLFLKHVPAAPLSRFVEYLWLLCDAPAHAKERILPTGTLELVINLHANQVRVHDAAGACRRLSGVTLSGAYTRPFVIDTAEHALAMGVHFRPGGAAPFTGAPPSALADDHVDLQDLWGTRATTLRERLCAARTHAERFGILEDALLPSAESNARRALVACALRSLERPSVNVREVAASAGLSHRHFARLFREHVGMAPKLFVRVRRFQRALTLAENRHSVDWAEVAADAGYYDQSHMIRDFGAFARTTPGEYLRRASTRVKDHHVVLG